MIPNQIIGLCLLALVVVWACMLFGAWIFHRGRSGSSPLPTLSRSKESASNDPKPLQLPKVRP